MRNEDDVQFRPRLKGRKRTERVPSISSLSRLVRKARGGHVLRGYRAPHVPSPKSYSRRVTVKMRFVKMNAYGRHAAKMHIGYLERDNVEKDGSRGQMYGSDGEFRRDDFIRVIDGEPHQFRIIISPEDAHELDLTTFTRDLMKQVEKDLGRELEWGAVNHYNTDHPHTHAVIRGIDRQGREVMIDREYISNGIRRRAQELATRELGVKSEIEYQQDMIRQISAQKVTSLDWRLEQLEQGGVITSEALQGRAGRLHVDKILLRRLQMLESLGLATSGQYGVWYMQEGWKERLRELGIREERFRTMHDAIGGDPSRYRILGLEHREIEGRLTRIGIDDEYRDRYYYIIETRDGKAYYADAGRHSNEAAYAEHDIVKAEMTVDSRAKKADSAINSIALKNDGIYSKEMHLACLKEDVIRLSNRKVVTKEEFVDAHVMRMHKLVSMGLAEPVEREGVWVVDPDMQQKIRELDAKQPLYRVRVQRKNGSLAHQETYRGRTWLDMYTDDPDAAGAHYGFGKEVREAARRRAVFLQNELLVDPADPARPRQLDRIEREDLASVRTQRTGESYLPADRLMKLRGTVSDTGALASGKRYAVISNERSREFSMVPWRKEYASSIGKQVEVIRQRTGGRWMMRQLGKDLGR